MGCAMAAASGATGVRSWLQTRHLTWLTPRRMKAVTIGLMSAAFAVSTFGLSGSTPPQRAAHLHLTTAKSAPAAPHNR